MQPSVFINEEGIIENVYPAQVDAAMLNSTAKITAEIAIVLRGEGRPVLVLADGSVASSADVNARLAARNYLQKVDFDRVAVIGLSGPLRYIASFIIQAIGLSAKVRIFPDRPGATAWLLELQHANPQT